MKYVVMFLMVLFPVVCFGSDLGNQAVSLMSDYQSGLQIGVSAYSAYRFMYPDKKAHEAAPWTYNSGKTFLALSAVTSGVSSFVGFKEGAKLLHIDSQINMNYVHAVGAMLSIGYLLQVMGVTLVDRATLHARDNRVRSETEEALLDKITPKSWKKRDKKSLIQQGEETV
jgi:hypothetical protein